MTARGRRGIGSALQYLLDTDWAIEYLRGSDRFVTRMVARQPLGIGISIIALAELYEGVAADRDRSRRERDLRSLVSGLQVLGVDAEIARIFGEERYRLRTAGQMIGDLDLLIGATAVRHDLTLLSSNRRHFERIHGLGIESI